MVQADANADDSSEKFIDPAEHMTKIVYNGCFGGFGLSEAAVLRYAEIKELRLYAEKDKSRFVSFGLTTYWLVPEGERSGILDDDDFHQAPMDERVASNKRYGELTLSPREISRTDPALVQVVEELGAAANGAYADLQIAKIPVGTRYRIDEYDGNERVMTIDDYDWATA